MKIYLTEREMTVLKNLVNGFKNEEISEKLHISIHTTKAHLEAIYDKLEVDNRVKTAIKSVKIGLIELETVKT